ncbi:type II secretion system protein [Massilia sp. LXY-6]|uniref:type II secretion system protein n=1 Tax=Massilia sp. LXY-6 TaxID=3379823 RepID=UPI003EDEBF02
MKKPFRKKRQGGFTLLQFALVVLVSSIVSAVALNRFEYYREQAEIAAARQVVASLRTSLQARAAQLLSTGRERELQQLASANPMNLLLWKPENYLGEYYAPDPQQIGGAGWVFDPRDRSLVYLPRNARSFSFGSSKLLRFKVEFVRISNKSLALNQVSG